MYSKIYLKQKITRSHSWDRSLAGLFLCKVSLHCLDNDFIKPIMQSDYSSPCTLVHKPNGTYRMCTENRKNALSGTGLISNSRNWWLYTDRIGKAKFVTKLIFSKDFGKCCSWIEQKEYLLLYRLTELTGMKKSPATSQRLKNTVISGLDRCDAYIDGITIYSDTFTDHLRTIRAFFDRLTEANLTVIIARTEFCHATVVFSGHVVGQNQVKHIASLVQAILQFLQHDCKRQLMRFFWYDWLLASILLQKLFGNCWIIYKLVKEWHTVCQRLTNWKPHWEFTSSLSTWFWQIF